MYSDYHAIECLKKAKAYVSTYAALGWKPISETEISVLENQKNELANMYGPKFARDYGWTMSILSEDQRNFKGMEKAVGKDYLRGIYVWASDNVHSGVSGNKDRLGLPDDS